MYFEACVRISDYSAGSEFSKFLGIFKFLDCSSRPIMRFVPFTDVCVALVEICLLPVRVTLLDGGLQNSATANSYFFRSRSRRNNHLTTTPTRSEAMLYVVLTVRVQPLYIMETHVPCRSPPPPMNYRRISHNDATSIISALLFRDPHGVCITYHDPQRTLQQANTEGAIAKFTEHITVCIILSGAGDSVVTQTGSFMPCYMTLIRINCTSFCLSVFKNGTSVFKIGICGLYN